MQKVQQTTWAQPAITSANVVLRKTYLLLSATLLFSSLVAGWAMITNARPLGFLITIVGYFGLLFLTTKLRDSKWGLVSVFAFTGFLGYTLGPILNMYLHTYVNGGQLIATSLGATAIIFFGLSGYALVSKKDFSYLGGFIMVGILGAFLLGVFAMVFHMPALSLGVSAAFILLCSGLILFQTSMIINGGETNYIMATITLYIALFNIFINLLQILGAFSGRD